MADCTHTYCWSYTTCQFGVRTQAERDADGCALPERISGVGGPLPPVPDCCYPADAMPLPVPRRRWWHRYTRRAR